MSSKAEVSSKWEVGIGVFDKPAELENWDLIRREHVKNANLNV